jgi:hypothetical protein
MLEKLINKHYGQTAFVCGLGSSLRDSLEYIKNNKDMVIVSCNDFDLQTELSPNYWVWSNPTQIESYKHRLEGMPNTILVHADSVDTTPSEWIKNNINQSQYIGYDQRHFNSKKCERCPNGCANFVDGRLTIQEHLAKHCNVTFTYDTGHTVALHMLALSILLGCTKIYISGVDLNYSKGYVNDKFSNNESFNPWIDEILLDFEKINNSAKNIGVEIINLSKESPLTKIFKN